MNIINWRKLSRQKDRPHNLFEFRNKAVKYFNLQKGEVIHHLRETEEQRQFNDQYYERWGFDFNGEMKYAVRWTVEEHNNYHSYNIEDKIKRSLAGKIGGAKNLGRRLTKEQKKNFGQKHKKLKWCNNGFKNIRVEVCPIGFVFGKLSNYKHSEETKQKLKEKAKLRGNNGLKYWEGKHRSDETKEKLKQKNLGKKQSKETIEKRKLTIKNLKTEKMHFGKV